MDSMIPGFNPMQMQPMAPMGQQGGGPNAMGLKILQAALNQRNTGQPQPTPQGGTLPGGSTNLVPASGINPMQMGLLAKLFGRGAPAAPGAVPDQGGAGPAPNALTGLW